MNDLNTKTLTDACARARTARTRLYVLIACEESQREYAAFRQLGHIAYSCDIQPYIKTDNPYWHIHDDVRPILHGDTAFNVQAGFLRCVPHWDLIISYLTMPRL